MTWYSRDSVQGYDKIGLAAYDSQCLEIHQKSFVISVLKVKLLLLNKTPEFSIKLNHFVIYNFFQDMFVQQHFVLKSIWIFYEAKIYYSDTYFYALFWFFGLKRHHAVSHQWDILYCFSAFRGTYLSSTYHPIPRNVQNHRL